MAFVPLFKYYRARIILTLFKYFYYNNHHSKIQKSFIFLFLSRHNQRQFVR